MKMTKAQQEKLERLRTKGKSEGQQKIVERGILQFRADEDTIRAILDAAEKEMIPVGTLLKKWIKEKLDERQANSNSTANVLDRLDALENNISRLTQIVEGPHDGKTR